MIPLNEIDYATVLKGTRVPIADLTALPMRREWVCDLMLLQLISDGAWTVCDSSPDGLALDPADPDVARVLDMRIAGRVGVVGFVWARLFIRDGHWSIAYGGAVHRGECGVGHLILNIEPVRENTRTARAALIEALYPAKR